MVGWCHQLNGHESEQTQGEVFGYMSCMVAAITAEVMRRIEAAVEDDEPQSLNSWVKITWGEFLNKLYAKIPTGSFMDLELKNDPFPEEFWYYYDVDVLLLRGAKVEGSGVVFGKFK